MPDKVAIIDVDAPTSEPMGAWLTAYHKLHDLAAKTNGTAATGTPRISNEIAAQVLRYVMHTVEKNKLDPAITEPWYLIAKSLAGWRRAGDRFKVDGAHRKAMLPDDSAVVLWTMLLSTAQAMDVAGKPFVTPTLAASDYDFVLRQAWTQMQIEARSAGKPAPPSPLPPARSPTPPADSGFGGLGMLILIYLIAEDI